MTTSFPGGLDSFTNPTGSDLLSTSVGGRLHSAMHADVNDAVEVIEAYVLQTLGVKKPVRAATTANITISTALNNGDSLDGVTLATDDLVLVKDQSTPAENGIYVVGVSPARSEQMPASAGGAITGMLVSVSEGTANADSVWMLTTNGAITPGTTGLTFTRQYPQSSETVAGLVELATTGEATTGTDTARAVTPAGLAAYAPAASATTQGKVELATDAEAETGTDTARAVTPANAAATYVKKSLGTAAGDIVYWSAASTPVRLAKGSDTQVLTLAAGVPSWATPSAGAVAALLPNSVADGSYSGPTATMTAGAGGVVLGDLCYMATTGKCVKADANAIATSSVQFIALATINADASGSFGLPGGFLHAASLYSWTVGSLVYLSATTAGLGTHTAPTGTDDVVQVIGVAYHADKLFFNPSLSQIEKT